jgi:sugar lactone lactonase YvrE
LPAGSPQGLAWDGEHIWTADHRTDWIYQLDAQSGNVVDSLPTPGYAVRGLAWDGRLLWCVDADAERIWAINPNGGLVETTIWCPVSKPGDLAWDGEYLWIADDAANQIHKISTLDGTTISTIKAPAPHPGGLAWDGQYLWVSDRIRDEIYMVTPAGGDVIITLDAPGAYAAGLAWDGEQIWCSDYQDDMVYELVVDDGTPFSRFDEKNQQVTFIHQVRNFGPDSMQELDVWIARPENMNNQELLGAVEFDPQPTAVITDKWDQDIAQFHFSDLAAGDFVEITMTAQATLYSNRYFVRPEQVGSLEEIPDDIKADYLVNEDKFAMDSEVIQKAVKAAVGDETNPYWIARKIFNYVIDHMEYELVGGWNIAPTVLERGNGSCSEYSFVYISMCRAAGLPARYVGSLVIRGDDASFDEVFHRWVEVYLPGFGWFPVDPSGGDDVWPYSQARSFGFLTNRFLITTAGGGDSEYLEWGYNANERWTSKGRCKIEVENFGEWSPLEE